MTFWSDARVERLEELWDRPYTIAEIAGLMGTTRGAIAGKAWRLHLPSKPKPKPLRRRRPARGKAFEIRNRRRVSSDYSWHLHQVAYTPSYRAQKEPVGLASWRTFRKRCDSDPILKHQFEAALSLRTQLLKAAA